MAGYCLMSIESHLTPCLGQLCDFNGCHSLEIIQNLFGHFLAPGWTTMDIFGQ